MSTLVLLHGFGGGRDSWQQVVDRLPVGTRALPLDLLGHHRRDGADRAPSVCTFEAEVDRLKSEIERVSAAAERVHLVGYSLGARLALGLLCARLPWIGCATLIGVNPGLESAEDRAERRANDERWAQHLEQPGTPEIVLEHFFEEWQRQPVFANQNKLAASVLETQRRLRRRLDPQGLARAMRALSLGAMPNYGERLEQIEVPVTLVVGELDTKFRSLARSMARTIAGASVVVVADAGHNVVLEAPLELADLLSKAPRSSMPVPRGSSA